MFLFGLFSEINLHTDITKQYSSVQVFTPNKQHRYKEKQAHRQHRSLKPAQEEHRAEPNHQTPIILDLLKIWERYSISRVAADLL